MSVLSIDFSSVVVAFGGAGVASLLGSGHCVGMCGGLVGFGARAAAGKGELAIQQLSRVLTYTALGGLAGFLGASLLDSGATAGPSEFVQTMTPFRQAALLLWGALWVYSAYRILRGDSLSWGSGSGVSRVFFSLGSRFGVLKPWIWGAGMAFLPCGWLQGFLMAAVLTRSPLLGGATLLAFGLGTVPALIGVQGFSRLDSLKLPHGWQRLRAVFVAHPRAAAALWLLLGGISLGLQAGVHSSHSRGESGAASSEAADDTDCHGRPMGLHPH